MRRKPTTLWDSSEKVAVVLALLDALTAVNFLNTSLSKR